LPLQLVQIALGALIAGFFNEGMVLEPRIFFVLFLPPLLFLDGWRIPNDGLYRDRATILELALGLVLFTVLGAGFLIHWMIPAMPLAVAFALAAVVSPTDPVAVAAITARLPMPPRMMRILQGESLLNDATALVCFRFAVAAALSGGFSLLDAGLTFLWVASAGLASGVAVTVAVSAAQQRLALRFGEEAGAPVLVSVLIPFGAYVAAEAISASGILAAVAAGVAMSRVELSGHARAVTRVQRAAVWDTLRVVLNGIMFVLLGEQLPGMLGAARLSLARAGESNPWWLAAYAAGLAAGLLALRVAWVWASLRWSGYKARSHDEADAGTRWRVVLASALSGVRGAITLAGVMSLPLSLPGGAPFPAREIAVFLAAAVIVLSILAAGIGLPLVLRGLPPAALPADRSGEDAARHAAAAAALAEIARLRAATPVAAIDRGVEAAAAARVNALYRRRLAAPSSVATAAMDAARRRRGEEFDRVLRLAGLDAERRAIFQLARAGDIADDTSRRLVREIDLVEARYR
jgi:CPA1 family monovalent cation:H+ antiporter